AIRGTVLVETARMATEMFTSPTISKLSSSPMAAQRRLPVFRFLKGMQMVVPLTLPVVTWLSFLALLASQSFQKGHPRRTFTLPLLTQRIAVLMMRAIFLWTALPRIREESHTASLS